jgi:hypothetical protein
VEVGPVIIFISLMLFLIKSFCVAENTPLFTAAVTAVTVLSKLSTVSRFVTGIPLTLCPATFVSQLQL